jgi:hypothetical protein
MLQRAELGVEGAEAGANQVAVVAIDEAGVPNADEIVAIVGEDARDVGRRKIGSRRIFQVACSDGIFHRHFGDSTNPAA